MAAEIIMPKLGLTMTEGTVDTWLKNEGDAITKGEVVCTISSEKLTHDVEATESGKLIQILVQAGEDAPCQAPIGLIGAEGEDVTDTEEKLDTQDKEGKNDEINEQSSAEKERQKDTSLQTDAVKKEGARFFITPLARKIAKEKGVDYTQINGTGGNGRITRRDIEMYVPVLETSTMSTTQPQTEVAKGLSGMRKTIAQRMMTSLHTTAQVTIQQKADITHLLDFITELKMKADIPLVDGQTSITTLLARAVVLALKESPKMNAWYDGEIYKEVSEIHLGIAVALPEGLVVPVIENADHRTLTDLGKTMNSRIHDVRAGSLDGSHYSGSTFTISNLGKSGVEYFTPILNQPEVGILGVGTLIKELALSEEGKIIEQKKLPLSLTFDHQIIDGSPAAEFLSKIIYYLEHPYSLVL